MNDKKKPGPKGIDLEQMVGISSTPGVMPGERIYNTEDIRKALARGNREPSVREFEVRVDDTISINDLADELKFDSVSKWIVQWNFPARITTTDQRLRFQDDAKFLVIDLGKSFSDEEVSRKLDELKAVHCGIRDLLCFWKAHRQEFSGNFHLHAMATLVPVRVSVWDVGKPGLWYPSIHGSNYGEIKVDLTLEDPTYQPSCLSRILARRRG